MERILLDLDGVLVDFVGGMMKALDKPWPFDRPEAMGEWDLMDLWGLEQAAFWEPCNHAAFWAALNWLADGREILRVCEREVGQANVYISTSPSLSPNAWKGKALWLQEHMPDYRGRVLMGSCKEILASAGVLVDDYDRNVQRFREAGGTAVLVPRPWNAGWGSAAYAVERVKSELYGSFYGGYELPWKTQVVEKGSPAAPCETRLPGSRASTSSAPSPTVA